MGGREIEGRRVVVLIKIDKHCTATLKVVTHEDQSVTVFVNHTHYAHTKRLQYITLSDRVRKGIASKLHRGISKNSR